MPRPSLREQLLDAGLRTFHERGFHATSVQDIAVAAGAPKGSFYNHFASKEALAVAALERYHDVISVPFAALQDATLPPRERVLAHFRAAADLTSAHLAKGCLLANAAAEAGSALPQLRERTSDAFARWTNFLADVIREGQQDGSIRSRLPAAQLAAFLVNANEGAVLRAKVDLRTTSLDHFLDIAARLLDTECA